MPAKFNSPQRVKAKCFAVFAEAFGCGAFSIVAISTNKAAEDVSPCRQIISASASIFSLGAASLVAGVCKNPFASKIA